jgi:hypothetical protein
MNHRAYPKNSPFKSSSLLLCMALFLSACADKGVTRDLEVDRYARLENEIIDAQVQEERRRAAEFKVEQKLQKLESDRAAVTLKRQQEQDALYFASENSVALSDETDTQDRTLSSSPVVTQIAIGQTSDDSSVWKLQNYPSPMDGSPLCAVVSTPIMVRNGTLDTFVSIIVTEKTVFLRTDATFDPDALETGFLIDAGFPIAFDSFFNVLTAVVEDSYDRLVSAMRSGTTLAVAFGYVPQLSSADTHVMELSLDTFEQTLPELAQCNNEASDAEPLYDVELTGDDEATSDTEPTSNNDSTSN